MYVAGPTPGSEQNTSLTLRLLVYKDVHSIWVLSIKLSQAEWEPGLTNCQIKFKFT